jgi:predicted transcriptional regulator
MKTRTGTFEEFKEYTLAVARGERKVDPREPKIWVERIDDQKGKTGRVRFSSLEAGAKLLSVKNRALLRTIATRRPRSIRELAAHTGRAEQNLLRTLRKLSQAGIVRLDKGEGRAFQPVVTAHKIQFEIDLLGR